MLVKVVYVVNGKGDFDRCHGDFNMAMVRKVIIGNKLFKFHMFLEGQKVKCHRKRYM